MAAANDDFDGPWTAASVIFTTKPCSWCRPPFFPNPSCCLTVLYDPNMSDPSLAGQALSTWDKLAPWWDAGITLNGNKYWQVLQEPSLSRLLSSHVSKPYSRALDLATGTGLCARWLAARGAHAVLAADGSEKMLEIASGWSRDDDRIKFRRLDVTSQKDWEGLIREEEEQGSGGKFDAVLINMAIMDIAEIETFAAAVPKLLRRDGM